MNIIRTAITGVALLVAGTTFAYNWSGKTGIVTLTESADVNDGDVTIVAALDGIVLQGDKTDVVFKNTSNLLLKGTITGDGRIIKQGAGDLCFGIPHTSTKSDKSGWAGCYQDYYTAGGIVVENGDLYFPQNGGAKCCYGPVTVCSGATLHVHPDATTALLSLRGEGTVSNGKAWKWYENADNQVQLLIGHYGATELSDFSGAFIGNFSLGAYGNVRMGGQGTDCAAMSSEVFRNAFGDSNEQGILRVNKFGNRPPVSCAGHSYDDMDFSAYASPLGVGTSFRYGVDYFLDYGGTLVYEGSGETTDKLFRFGGRYNPGYDTIDAGGIGGVTFTGSFESNGSTRYYGVVLRGSNTVEMTMRGTVDGGDGRVHYVKDGVGTWNWDPKTTSALAGAWFIVGGTLKFPTIANIGENCALGAATNCWKSAAYAELPAYWGDSSNRLDCEVVLGDWSNGDSLPTMAYTGSSVASTDRRIGLIGKGGVVASATTTGSLKLAGTISPRTVAAVKNESKDMSVSTKTLRLEAVGGGNEIGGLAENAAGTVTLVKTGAGEWTVKNDFSIHGDIEVREGTLSFDPKGALPYSWYRFTIMQLNNPSDAASQYCFLRQLGLFDADGNRLLTGLRFIGPESSVYKGWHGYAGNYDYTTLPQGCVTMGEFGKELLIDNEGSTPAELFADSSTFLRITGKSACQLDDLDSYIPIVFRLPEGSTSPRYYDIVQDRSCGVGSHVGAFKLEGSTNGRDWFLLSEVRDCLHRENGKWYSTNVDEINGQGQNCRTPDEFGYVIKNGQEERDTIDLMAANEIKVARGATLQVLSAGVVELPKLSVDFSGEGNVSVKGFKIAAAGVLTITNEPKAGVYELPVDFIQCSDLLKIENWRVVIGGRDRDRDVRVVGSKVVISRKGMVLLVR